MTEAFDGLRVESVGSDGFSPTDRLSSPTSAAADFGVHTPTTSASGPRDSQRFYRQQEPQQQQQQQPATPAAATAESHKAAQVDSRAAVYRPSLRLVVAATTAVVVVIITVLTLFVSNFFAERAAQHLGSNLAKSLAGTASAKADAFFSKIVDASDALSKEPLRDFPFLPTDSLRMTGREFNYRPFCAVAKTVSIMLNYTNTATVTLYMDGSFLMNTHRYDLGASRCGAHVNAAGTWSNFTTYFISNSSDMPDADSPPEFGPNSNLRTASQVMTQQAPFLTVITDIARINPAPFWAPSTAYLNKQGRPSINIGVVHPIFNRSNYFLGVTVLALPTESLHDLVHSIDHLPDGVHIFLIDQSLQVLASTVPEANTSFYFFQDSKLPFPKHCLSNGDTGETQFGDLAGIVCPENATHFPYAPLNAVANNLQLLLARRTTQETVQTADGPYLITSSPIHSSVRLMSVQVVSFVPKSAILGEIETSRFVAAGIALFVLIVGIVGIIFVIFVIMNPLADLLERMHDVTQLNMDDDDSESFSKNMSSVHEIYRLQESYLAMVTAVQSFVRYTPREVVKDLLQKNELCRLGMTPVVCSIFFSDIEGFSSISERVPPDELSGPLSLFFERSLNKLDSLGLCVDKMIGDAILAVGNAPCAVINHEIKCVLAMLEVTRECCVNPLRDVWDAIGERLVVRIGGHVGDVLAGNMGSPSRMAWTVISKHVNLASRLEGFNKQMGTRLMISDDLACRVQFLAVLRLLIAAQVVGMEEPVRVWEVVGLKPNAAAQDIDEELSSRGNSLSFTNRSRQNSSDKIVGAAGARRHSGDGIAARVAGSNSGNRNADTASNNSSETRGSSNNTKVDSRFVLSNRLSTKRTTKQLVCAVAHHHHASLVATDLETAFCEQFSRVARHFCEGEAAPCLDGLAELRSKHEVFFTGTEADLRALHPGMKHRCEGTFVHADKSAKILQMQCKLARDADNDSSLVGSGGSAGSFVNTPTSPTVGFVYRATEK